MEELEILNVIRIMSEETYKRFGKMVEPSQVVKLPRPTSYLGYGPVLDVYAARIGEKGEKVCILYLYNGFYENFRIEII